MTATDAESRVPAFPRRRMLFGRQVVAPVVVLPGALLTFDADLPSDWATEAL